jgi:hypothetical protein
MPQSNPGEEMRKLAIAVLLFFIASTAFAQLPGATPFSGDLTIKTKASKNMTGKVYVGGTKMRMDINGMGRGMIMINDLANKISYMLMPTQRMYMEMRVGEMAAQRGPKMPDLNSYDPNNPCAQTPDMTCEKVGSETVNGRSTDKWIFKTKKDGKTMTAWLDRKVAYPIRTISDGNEMDLTNIQEGMPAASLFEIPSGYKKFDMGSMMRGQTPDKE